MYRITIDIEMDTNEYDNVLHLQEEIHRTMGRFRNTRFGMNVIQIGVDPAMRQFHMTDAFRSHSHSVPSQLSMLNFPESELTDEQKEILLETYVPPKEDFLDEKEMEL